MLHNYTKVQDLLRCGTSHQLPVLSPATCVRHVLYDGGVYCWGVGFAAQPTLPAHVWLPTLYNPFLFAVNVVHMCFNIDD
jgi:hypothetical protein